MQGFKQFIMRGNAVDLAVGVVFGAAFGAIVNSFVNGLITPLIGAMVKAPDFSQLYFTVNSSKFMYGNLINAVVSFLIIATTIYFFCRASDKQTAGQNEQKRADAGSHNQNLPGVSERNSSGRQKMQILRVGRGIIFIVDYFSDSILALISLSLER